VSIFSLPYAHTPPAGRRVRVHGARLRKARSGVVVHVKAVGATTELGAVSAANHRTTTSSCWSATIGDCVPAIYKKQSEWTNVES
jgi:hypothetical protein